MCYLFYRSSKISLFINKNFLYDLCLKIYRISSIIFMYPYLCNQIFNLKLFTSTLTQMTEDMKEMAFILILKYAFGRTMYVCIYVCGRNFVLIFYNDTSLSDTIPLSRIPKYIFPTCNL